MITFDETKRQANVKIHGLDFIGCDAIWDNFTITREDKRHAYGEKRLVTFGLLKSDVVVLVHTERGDTPHIISLRKAEKYEARYYFETAKGHFS
ncbi:MAG: BrnT family toxin [Acidobacteriales bacterium]|nr:BrnT family toxin [Terriglobales bacterium]MCI0423519.1 BrnT family toxin [Acidobacteriota bacterium]MCI0624474.1 BrnT family toxin [Acidobacteriota bacterium]MCI0718975.1 BrnT family toxin [Acidobacteriota bacterium]